MDVPGATGEGIVLEPGPVAGTLQISVPTERTPLEGVPLRQERGPHARTYARLVAVAWDADVRHAKASVSHGVLTLSVPKNKEERSAGNEPASGSSSRKATRTP